ncbi:MAG: SIMPL domain-containing protein [Dehalococcoidales bacterium]|nr:MAG: SIMPL domain-containing protein [Dehalococcoidales bacterium]
MKKFGLLVAGVASVLAILVLAGCTPVDTNGSEVKEINLSSQQEGIWVSGMGKVTVVPDIASLRLGIEAEGDTVSVARDQAAEAMDAVMTALTENGVADNDIQTEYFTIRRITQWDREKEQEVITGYRVINMVTAKIRDIDNIGTVIDAVADAGGDLTRVDSIDFTVDDPSDYYDEAREEAMAEARDKAEQLAELAGVILGNATYISEGSQIPPVTRGGYAMDVAEEMEVETPVSPGELEVILTVQVIYAIED